MPPGFADVPGMAVTRAPTATASSARIIDRLTGGTSADIRKMPLRRSRLIPAMPFAKPRAPTEMAKPYWRIGVGRARYRDLIRYFVVLPSTNSGDPERHSCQTSEKIFIADWVKNEGKKEADNRVERVAPLCRLAVPPSSSGRSCRRKT